MYVAIISDIHNNETNLKKVLEYCRINQIEKIICCGDLASLETLDFLDKNFSGEIFYTFGNMDDDFFKHYSFDKDSYGKIKIFRNFGEMEIDGQKIAFVHFPRKARELCASGKYQFVFYGHTHDPWEEKINECLMLNPGNVTGTRSWPTFAVWDTKKSKFKLVRINELKFF